MNKIDVVVCCSYGDSAKGKVVNSLLKKNKYTHVLRFAGGGNCGHTIYHNGKKHITHVLPAGFFNNVKSIIGPCCVINIDKFFEEMNYFAAQGFDVYNLVKIAQNTHITTPEHIIEDSKDVRIGTTKQGIGPCYRDKYARIGKRAKDFVSLKPFLIDMYEEFYGLEDNVILAEGSQGFGLDIDHGDYPFVTSCSCLSSYVCQSGFPANSLRNVYGTIKAYTTYVGSKRFQPDGKIFNQMQEVGKEFGATTGRKRQCNWNNMSLIKKAVMMNGVTHLIISKCDVLNNLKTWAFYDHDGQLIYCENERLFKEYVENEAKSWGIKHVLFSYSPEEI